MGGYPLPKLVCREPLLPSHGMADGVMIEDSSTPLSDQWYM